MLSAWVCFGGYGSRTRRGLGKLIPDCSESRALVPTAITKDGLEALLPSLFSQVTQPNDWPRLRGVYLAIGKPNQDCVETWHTALSWIRDFRKGEAPSGNLGDYNPNQSRARGQKTRSSISNWPEADKLRQLTPGNWSHPPRHNANPVWPKAALGLPVVSTTARIGGSLIEPANFELNWQDRRGYQHDRLGSPLLIGAIPIRNNEADEACSFAPYALWINRSYPEGQVIATRNKIPIDRSAAPFDQLVATGDHALFPPWQPPGIVTRNSHANSILFLVETTPTSNYLFAIT